MFTCTALRQALLEWQKNNGVHQNASKSKLKAERPDSLNDFNCKNDGGKITCCCADTGCKLLTSPGVADRYICLMNTWNILQESYQQMVSNHTLATVKSQIQQSENPTPAVVISMEAARVVITILLDYSTSQVALQEAEIGSPDPTIPIELNCTNDNLNFRIRGGSGDCEGEGDESDAISKASGRWRATMELDWFDRGTSDVDGYDGEDGGDPNADEEEEASQADDGSMQNVEDWGDSTRDFENWTVYSDMFNTIMAKQMQWQAMYPNRSLYCNEWQNLNAKHKWECGMWLSAKDRHKHCQPLCKWLLHNSNTCKEFNIRDIQMVRICHHIPDPK